MYKIFHPVIWACLISFNFNRLLFFVLLIASVMLTLICITLGPDPIRIRVGLVNQEVDYHSICSNITRVSGECNVKLLSCRFLLSVPEDNIHWVNTIKYYSEEIIFYKKGGKKWSLQKHYDNEDEAIMATQRGNTWGHVVFSFNFSMQLYERITFSGAGLIDELAFNTSIINVRLDESSMFGWLYLGWDMWFSYKTLHL